MTVHVFCESTELMVEAAALAAKIGLAVKPELSGGPLAAAAQHLGSDRVAVALVVASPTIDDALTAVQAPGSGRGRLVLGWLGHHEGALRDALRDLGIVCVADVGPALSAAAWLDAGAGADIQVAARRTTEIDKVRLGKQLGNTEQRIFRIVSLGADGLALVRSDADAQVHLGYAAWVRDAARAIRESDASRDAPLPFRVPPDLALSRDVLFGPPRKLSDPASKAALAPFGLPLPQEELCGSPSRASSEAARIGFPVRIALASPDLRVWDHPELSVDGVDNAARVRDLFRQLTMRASTMSPSARILGVSVTATTLARALLRLSARPARDRRVTVSVGFADPHGIVTRDVTATVLPASRSAIERALRRLRGHALLFDSEGAEREQTLDLLAGLITQLACFVDAFRSEVERVDLNPVAVLVGGGAEVREAAIQVTDAFVRELG